jgi:integrase
MATPAASDALPTIERRRYQRGALRKERKRWILRLRTDVPVEPGEKRKRCEKRIVVGTVLDLPTRALARRAADAMLPVINPTRTRSAEGTTISGFAPVYLTDVVSLMKPASARSVRSIVSHYIVPMLGHYRLEMIVGRVPQQFIAKLHAKKLARKSLINCLVVLGRMLDLATDQGYGVTRFSRRHVKLPPDELDHDEPVFSPEQRDAIVAAAQMPWSVLYAILGELGLRIGEGIGLAWEHIDFEASIINVRQAVVLGRVQTLKSKNSKADLPMSEALSSRLAAYRLVWKENPQGLLFTSIRGKPIWADSLRRYQFAPLLAKLGISIAGAGRYGPFHAFRHGAATNLFAGGASAPTVRSILRHGDLKTTMRYTHVVLEDQRAAIQGANALGRGEAVQQQQLNPTEVQL